MTDPKKKTKRKQPLTERQKKLLKYLPISDTKQEAAIRAGYSEKSAGTAANLALKNIKEKAPDIFERNGLDDDGFIKNYLLPALNAKETKFFAHNGRVISTRDVVAWGPRVTTNRLVAELKGLIVKERDTPSTSIRVVVVNAQDRPPIRGTSLVDIAPA